MRICHPYLVQLGRVLTTIACITLVPCSALANPALRGYANYESYARQVGQLDRSEVVSASSLCKTLGGRDVFLLTMGVPPTDQKPALLIVGNVHEPHLVGAELAMRIAQQLAEGYTKDESVKKLLAKYTFYIIPRPNPDGSEGLWSRPWRERAGNDRRTDDDRDFRLGEDPPNDLNGDGWITMMRVEDETGSYMPHSADGRVMVRADAQKNERGSYRLYSEGVDDDRDERWNEDAGDGVSFNRNFTFRYPHFEPGAGPHAVSERESRAVADFAFDHPNIAVVLTFTPEDNLMAPWRPSAAPPQGRIITSVLAADVPYFEFLSERYKKIHGGKGAPAPPTGAGSFSEWAYYHYGRWSLAARAWWPPAIAATEAKEPGKGDGKPAGEEKPAKPAAGDGAREKPKAETPDAQKRPEEKRGQEELSTLRWFAQQQLDGFLPWTPISHPDFPGKRVEVGGFRPFYRLNPPAQELDALGEKHVRFVIELSSLMPELKLPEPKVESLGAGIYRITSTVANAGYLPTMSEMGSRSQQMHPLQMAIGLPEKGQVLQGPARRAIGRLAGNGGRSQQTWLVRVPGRQPAVATLRVWAPAVGSAERKIELK